MNLTFWKSTAERSVKTFAQAILALLGTGSVGITTLDWPGILSVAATAALASVLTSLASLSSVVPNNAPAAPSEPWSGTSLKDAVASAAPVVEAPAATFPAAKIDALPEAPAPAVPVEVVPVVPAAPAATV